MCLLSSLFIYYSLKLLESIEAVKPTGIWKEEHNITRIFLQIAVFELLTAEVEACCVIG